MRHASGRYLFVVDTSAAMRSRSPAVQKALSNLLLSGMHAQLQPGDAIGVWTYNQQLYAGRLPLQPWTPESEQLVASNILAFLDGQTFEKKSQFNVVWPELEPLVKESEKLTVLLISDGSETISGTPFDNNINEFFKKNARKQKQKRMPFITVLRSYRGKFTGGTLNLAPWPVEFPPFPPEAKVAAAPKPKPPPQKVALRPTAPPLIVIGEKPEPVFIAPAAQSDATPAKPAPTEAAAAPAQPATPPLAPTPTSTPAATPETKPTSPSVIASPTEPPHAPTLPSVKPEPTPVTPSAPANELKPEPAPPGATEKQAPTTPPAQVATAIEPQKILGPAKLMVIGVVLLVLAGAAFFLVRRHAHASAHASLITRSMDQDQK